jgi:tetratricopeptide (TPR) repeat protein
VIAWLRGRLAEAHLAAARDAEARANAAAPFDQRAAALRPALRRYRWALAVAPRGSAVWTEAAFRLGSLLAGENSVRDPPAAVALLEAVDTAPACYFLGEAYALQGRFDEAEAAWRRGLALDPRHRGLADVLARLPADRASAARRRGRPGR